jgi:hypothetical protein
VTVTSVSSGGGKTTPAPIGGTLFFPGGRYYCATSSLRMGANVRWLGNHFYSTRLAWSNSFSGNHVVIGPGQSGYNGWDGSYAYGTELDQISIETSPVGGWAIYTTGAQQNVSIRNLWIYIQGSASGMHLQDHFGSTYIKAENIYILPTGTATGGSVVGIRVDGPACTELNRISMNGSGGSNQLSKGINVISGGLLASNIQMEFTSVGIDISATAGQSPITIDNFTANLSGNVSPGYATTPAVYIRSGYTGSVVIRNLNAGSQNFMLRNDNTNEQITAPSGGQILDLYSAPGTVTDLSILRSVITVPPVSTTTANSASSFPVDVSQAQTLIFNSTVAVSYSIQAPTISSSALTSADAGRRVKFVIKNASAGAITATFLAAGAGYRGAGGGSSNFAISPATGTNVSIEFEWNGSLWYETYRTSGNVTNT